MLIDAHDSTKTMSVALRSMSNFRSDASDGEGRDRRFVAIRNIGTADKAKTVSAIGGGYEEINLQKEI